MTARNKDAILKISHATFLTIDGYTRRLWQWCESTGNSNELICMRLRRGWSVREAVLTPPRPRRPNRKTNSSIAVPADAAALPE